MFAPTILVLGFLTAVPPEATGPRLEKGLEVRWTGTFSEASFRPGFRALRDYDVETRLFVLDVSEGGADAVLFNRVFLRPEKKSLDAPVGIVRIDLVRINSKGKLQVMPSPADPDNPVPKARAWPLVQLQGLPIHEGGLFVEAPDGIGKIGHTWTIEESGRPKIEWKVADAESVKGQPGYKLVGEQHTERYYDNRVAQPEWRRQDTLCILPSNGFASRYERIIERREPEADELAFRSSLKLEQTGRIVYSGQLFEERREEVIHATGFTSILDRLLADGGRSGAKPFEALIRRISAYQADHIASDSVPYREAIRTVKKRAESAAQGNLPPTIPPEITLANATSISGTVAPKSILEIGRVPPDVLLTPLNGNRGSKLSKQVGRPVVLAYFQPTSPNAPALVKLIDSIQAKAGRTGPLVVPLVIGDEQVAAKLVAKQRMMLFDGNAIYQTHGLESTPAFVILDHEGIVRAVIRGWDSETGTEIVQALKKLEK